MAKKHGITSSTPGRFVLDSGAVYKNYGTGGEVLIGATRGGSELTIEREQREMPVDGAAGPMKGAVRTIKVSATLKCKFIETSKTVLQAALAGCVVADYPATQGKTHDKFTGTLALSSGDYTDSVSIVANTTGSASNYFIATLKNVLSLGGLSMSFADADESGIEVTFKAHFDPSTMETEPWEIYNPIIA